jgi:Uncharacterized conserved protein
MTTLLILLQDTVVSGSDWFSPGSTFFHICGWVASIGLILGYIPQAWQTIRTRRTDDIALPTFLMMAVGSIAFIMQGVMMGINGPNGEFLRGPGAAIFCTNLVTVVCSLIIFAIKMHNDFFKKK